MTRNKIADRLTAIETELAALKAKASGPNRSHPIQALDAIRGTVENDQVLKEATVMGRKWHWADRPATCKPKAKRK